MKLRGRALGEPLIKRYSLLLTSANVILDIYINYFQNDSPYIGENIVVSLTDATAISGASAFNYVLSLTGAPTTTENIIDPFINVDKLTGTRFTMYPNPVSNMLTVETGTSEILKIRLLSITGKEVFAGEITNKMQIDTSSLHPGIYFIAIIDGAQ